MKKPSCKGLSTAQSHTVSKEWLWDSDLKSGSRAQDLMCSPKAELHAWYLVGPNKYSLNEWEEP